MSSSCSSTDLGIDTDFDDVLSETLINDIELFAEHMHRLRRSLDVKRPPLSLGSDASGESGGNGGATVNETKCVQVHAALSMVSQSIRDLLVKHPHFKTSNVLIPASQLVHSVKGINFGQSNFDASRALHSIERLEAAIGNALRHCVNTKLFVGEHTPNISIPLHLHHNHHHHNNNGAQQHPLKQATTNNKDNNDTNNNSGSGGGTRQQQQLIGNEDALNNNREYYYANGYCSGGVGGQRPPTSATGGAIGTATAQLLIGAGGLMTDHPTRRGGVIPSVLKTTPLATKQPHGGSSGGKTAAPRLVRRHSAYQAGAGNKLTGSSSATVHPLTAMMSSDFANNNNNNNNMKNIDSAAQLMRDALVAHEHGMELAFDRCKRWSKYASHLLQFIRGRLALEQEQARSAQKLAEQTRALLVADAENHHLPLVGVFEQLMDGSAQFAGRVQHTVNILNQRFIATLESRQKEHDAKRRKLKTDWTKQKKQFDACAEELRRARLTLNTKEGGYLKARDLAMRHEQQVVAAQQQQQPMIGGGLPSSSLSSMGGAGGGAGGGASSAVLSAMLSVESSFSATAADPQQQKKLEKKRKNEEDALIRKTDAENEVWRLEREWEARRLGLNKLRYQIVGELCDSIRHCDLTTIACSSHFFKAFAELWAPLPDEFDRLAADAMRERSPSTEYMQFLHGLPPNNNNNNTKALYRNAAASISDDCATASSSSMLAMKQQRVSASLDDDAIRGGAGGSGRPPSTPAAGSQSAAMPRRRNALNADEHYELISDPMVAGAQRRQKKSMTRLFEQSSSSSSVDAASDAARSHQLQRTRQVTKCAHCEHLVIFDALKCSTCGIVWHKKCLSAVTVICGPSARRLSEDPALAAQRRMSIFGVPLAGHLDAQHRRIPHIMERCVDELQRRGMSCKGLYRTCGVKSKIEQLCVRFEQLVRPDEPIDLSNVHPMNLASVIKLYLRRLPEPLMTYELYDDWLHFNACDLASTVVMQLRDLVSRLPQQNYDTLKFLILHLKRVTWFELENLMTASNLAAVISPSLIWQRSASLSLTASMDVCPISATSGGGNGSSSFINDAHQQTKVVELMVQNAYEVFLVDRSTDWHQFFETYPDVVPPKLVEDPETEASIAAKSRAELSLKRRSCVASTSAEAPRADEDDDVDEEEEEEEEELDEELDEDDDVYDICGCNAPPNSSTSTNSSASKPPTPFGASKSLEEQSISGRYLLQRRPYVNRQMLPPPHPSSAPVGVSVTVSQLPVYQRSPSAPAPVLFDTNVLAATTMTTATPGGAMISSTCSTTTSSSSSKAERKIQPTSIRATSSNSGSIASGSASSSVDGHTNAEHGFQRNTTMSGSGGGGGSSAAAKALNRFVGLKRFRNQRSNIVGTTNDDSPITVVITSSSAVSAATSGTKSAPHTAQPTAPPLTVATVAIPTATRSVSTSNDASASSFRPSTTAVYASPLTSRRRRPPGDSLTHNGGGGGKPRNFTTSILVSPQSDRKFATILAQKQQPLVEDCGDADRLVTALATSASACAHMNGASPMNGGGALTARRKLRETARSYQRLNEDENDVDVATDEYFGASGYRPYDEYASSASSDPAHDEDDDDAALRRRRRRAQLAAGSADNNAPDGASLPQQSSTRSKRTLCSGEVVVDIKKEQFCVPQTARSARAVGRNGAPLSSASFTTMTTFTESPTNAANDSASAINSNASRASLRKDTSVDAVSPPPPPTNVERKQRLERSPAYRNVAEVVVKSRGGGETAKEEQEEEEAAAEEGDDKDDCGSQAASRSIYENANGGCATKYQSRAGNYNRIAAAAAAALTGGIPKALSTVKSGGGGVGGSTALEANVIFTGSGDVSYV